MSSKFQQRLKRKLSQSEVDWMVQRGKEVRDEDEVNESKHEADPFTAKDQSRIHQFGKKVLPGLFLGYALYAGGIWKGDVLISDLEELETWTHRKSTNKD